MSVHFNRRHRLAVVLEALVLVGAAACTRGGTPSSAAAAPPPMGVSTLTLQKKPIEQSSGFIATIRSLRRRRFSLKSRAWSPASSSSRAIVSRSARRSCRSSPTSSRRRCEAPKPAGLASRPTSSTGGSRSSGSKRSWRLARSAVRNSTRRRIRCARPRRGSPR